ncbi:MAG: DUF6089 family protein [Cytophagales bacterium]
MLKKVILGALALSSLSSLAQTKDAKWGVGVNAGLRDYRGDLGNGFFKLSQNDVSAGAWAYRYLNPSFDAGLSLNFGGINYKHIGSDSLAVSSGKIDISDREFRGSLLDYSLGLKYKFNNGYILKENATLAPFLGIGVGGVNTFNIRSTSKNGSYVDEKNLFSLNIPATVGLKLQLEERVALVGQLTYNYLLTDKLEAIESDKYGKNDKYLQYNLGFIFALGKPKDTDGDGVPDKLDKCPDTRAGVKVTLEGCDLDTDGDGVSDADDKCPTEKGIAKFEGCPDSDNDGVKDSEDKCPTVAGVAAFAGCPDTDGDGIQDSEDKCPTVAGIATFGGCPDTDGDGIQDSEDKCPSVAGVAALAGCPDADGDGVTDAEDKCPSVAGIAANSGCPEIKQEVLQRASLAAKGIFFQTGSDVIKKESIDDLDNLVKLMTAEPLVKAEVQGHTDNVGDAAKNKALSQKRADAVAKYLVSKGVDASRLTSVGYGSEMPIADNKTAAGKSKNRRVEFKLGY